MAGVAVFDIDGVLADVRHRLHHVERRPRDWDAFFAAAPEDPVLAEGRRAVDQARESGCTIAYLTGRPERCRADTARWLARHGFPAGDLLMRPDHDRRPARDFKAEALGALADRSSLERFVDDDPQVVDALAALGLPVVRADWMDRAADGAGRTLDKVQEVEGRS